MSAAVRTRFATGDAKDLWIEPMTRAVFNMLIKDPPDTWMQKLAMIKSLEWVPPRPTPSMPPLWKIVCYWAAQDGPFSIDLETPHCFACLTVAPFEPGELAHMWNRAGPWLQKGHLINRSLGGLDCVQNLIPLCKFCNHLMPEFGPGQGIQAMAWVLAGGGAARLHAGLVRVEPTEPATPKRRRTAEIAGQDTLFCPPPARPPRQLG